jgi:hypothetical protein
MAYLREIPDSARLYYAFEMSGSTNSLRHDTYEVNY